MTFIKDLTLIASAVIVTWSMSNQAVGYMIAAGFAMLMILILDSAK